jgi:ABC-type bacteriocin/lantibiotic exporter with double-glycine peptidase domain
MPSSLYAYVWRISGRQQIVLAFLTLLVAGLTTLPLELQRRIVSDAVKDQDLTHLMVLSALYLALLLVQGGGKYVLNVYRGRVVETATVDLRERICKRASEGPLVSHDAWGRPDQGAVVSMVAAEAEMVGGFVGESLSAPLLQSGTLVFVIGYLLWVEPLVAAVALVVYLPTFAVVPLGQRRINHWSASHARAVRWLGDAVVAGEFAVRFKRLVRLAFFTRIRFYRIKYFLTFFENLLDAVGPLAILLVGGFLVIRGYTEVSTLVVFISGFQRISAPWDQLVTFYRTVSTARVRYRLIADALEPLPAPNGASARRSA